jgi:hypothetical protein
MKISYFHTYDIDDIVCFSLQIVLVDPFEEFLF